MTPAGKFWTLYVVIGAVLLLALSTCFAMPREQRRIAYLAVLCPDDWHWTISQRYDERDWFGIIVAATWITRCG